MVYVDNDPIAGAHARALLTSATGHTAYIDADARDVHAILDMAAVPPGSYLAISHPARDQLAIATKAEESLTKSMRQKVTFRTHDEVAGFFAGLELLEPGVVPVQEWRPTSDLDLNSKPTAMWGGVGYKG